MKRTYIALGIAILAIISATSCSCGSSEEEVRPGDQEANSATANGATPASASTDDFTSTGSYNSDDGYDCETMSAEDLDALDMASGFKTIPDSSAAGTDQTEPANVEPESTDDPLAM